MIVFLDFDGVLRRDSSPPSCFQTDCLENFESAIRPFVDFKIVISSSWRVALSLKEIRGLFSHDIGERIVGVTPEFEFERNHARYKEIIAFLAESERQNRNWIAIDDSPELFPSNAPLLLVQSSEGFTEECAVRFRQMVLSAGSGE